MAKIQSRLIRPNYLGYYLGMHYFCRLWAVSPLLILGLNALEWPLQTRLESLRLDCKTVATQDLLPFLQELCARESVEILVVGEPKQRLGNASLVEQDILKFIEQFRALCPEVAIHLFDERFTSKLAMRALIDSGVSRKKRQDKALVDQISATIILQDYLKTHS